MLCGRSPAISVQLQPNRCGGRGAVRPLGRCSTLLAARAARRVEVRARVKDDGDSSGRRAAVAMIIGSLATMTPEARAEAAEGLAEEADSGVGGYIRKAGKLGVVLLLADVVTGVVLGKSAFDIATNKTEPGGWKEKLADQIMGKEPEEPEYPLSRSQEEWKAELTAEEYRILRLKGTERPMTGEYNKFYPDEGHFKCAGCGNPLYSAQSKFDSGCGWPAFDKCYEGSVATISDTSMGMRRVEILCQNCGGHLGHVFEGEQFTSTNERHCVNSVSIKYDAGKQAQPEKPVTK